MLSAVLVSSGAADCTIADFRTAPGNVTVNANVVLTIAPTGILEVDFANNDLLVKDSGGVLVKQGGSLAQTGRLSPPQSSGSTENLLVFHHADHLTGASVDTDNQGTLIQLTDYYPFGDSRIEDTTTAFHNDYTYTGKERDEDTELLYYEARYYDSGLGRFLSLDKASGVLTDPQRFNRYTYVLNNPLTAIDPDGLLTIFIHGTVMPGKERGTYSAAYKNKVTSDLGDSRHASFNWSGGNSQAARLDAANELRTFVGNYQFSEGESLNIVAHSHGGNVAINAINDGLDVDTLVTLGTPVRKDTTLSGATKGKVGTFVNVVHALDTIQVGGSFRLDGNNFGFVRKNRYDNENAVNLWTIGGSLLNSASEDHSWLRSMGAWESIKSSLVDKDVLEYDTEDDGTVRKHRDGTAKTKKKQ